MEGVGTLFYQLLPKQKSFLSLPIFKIMCMVHGKGRCWYMTVLHYCHSKGLNVYTNYLSVTCRWTVVNNREDIVLFCVQVNNVGRSYHLVSVFGQ